MCVCVGGGGGGGGGTATISCSAKVCNSLIAELRCLINNSFLNVYFSYFILIMLVGDTFLCLFLRLKLSFLLKQGKQDCFPRLC